MLSSASRYTVSVSTVIICEACLGDDFKPQHYLIKTTAAALIVEHVIGQDRPKTYAKHPSLPLLPFLPFTQYPAETLVYARSSRP